MSWRMRAWSYANGAAAPGGVDHATIRGFERPGSRLPEQSRVRTKDTLVQVRSAFEPIHEAHRRLVGVSTRGAQRPFGETEEEQRVNRFPRLLHRSDALRRMALATGRIDVAGDLDAKLLEPFADQRIERRSGTRDAHHLVFERHPLPPRPVRTSRGAASRYRS